MTAKEDAIQVVNALKRRHAQSPDSTWIPDLVKSIMLKQGVTSGGLADDARQGEKEKVQTLVRVKPIHRNGFTFRCDRHGHVVVGDNERGHISPYITYERKTPCRIVKKRKVC